MVKSKLPPQSGPGLDIESMKRHPWKRTIKSFFIKLDIWLKYKDHWSMIGETILSKGRIQVKLGSTFMLYVNIAG